MSFAVNTPVSDPPVAIPSMSLGRAWVHELDVKLSEAAQADFNGIELVYKYLLYVSKKSGPAARWARKNECGLNIMAMQPFMNYDGLLDEDAHKMFLYKLHLCFQFLTVKELSVDLIQVPTQMLSEGTTGGEDKLVADLTELGQLGLKENRLFVSRTKLWPGEHTRTYGMVWRIVQRVKLPNVGMVFDSFQIAGRVYGDNASSDGKNPNAEAEYAASLAEMAKTVDVEKVFYVQLSDAELLSPPISPSHPYYDAAQPARMSWSRNARLFPCESERGGYLPVVELARVWFHELGWRGWVSMEIFSRTMSDPNPSVPRSHAQRGMES